MREGNFNRVERAERVEKGSGVSSQELGLAAKNTKSAKPWPMVRLGDVCEISRGRVMSKLYLAKHQGQYPVYSSQTKNDGVFGYIDTYDFDGEYLTWTTDGANAGSVFYHNGKFSVTNVCGLLRVVNDSVWTKWLLYCLRFCAKSYVNKSLGNPKLMSNVVSRIEIKVPPLSVQKEIVKRLEKELGEADKVAAEFKRMVELADKEFKAELDETFGGLGEKGLGVSSQELGLAATTFAKATVVKKNAKSAKDWPMVRLGDVAEIKYGYTAKKVVEKENDYPCYLRITDIQDGEVDWKSVPYCQCDDIEAYRLMEGDIVFARTGATTGKSFLLRWDFPLSVFASYLIRVRIEDWKDLYSIYLKYYFDTSEYWDKIKVGIAGAAQGGFNSKKLAEIQFPLPPIEVQKEIVAKFDAAKERCEKLKAEAERGLRAAENLRKAILSEAFEL